MIFHLKRFLFFIGFLAAIQATGTCITSEVYLKMYDHSPFTLIFDNQVYRNPSNYYRMGNLVPGHHYLQVSRTLSQGITSTDIIYNGQVYIPQASRVYLLIDPYGQLKVLNVVPYNTFFPQHPNTNYYGSPHNQELPYRRNNISEESFENLIEHLEEIPSDQLKMVAVKDALFYSHLKSEQVVELMKLFSFDKEKLDLAKYAFHFTSDKENYYLVDEGFIFASTKEQLRVFLRNTFY